MSIRFRHDDACKGCISRGCSLCKLRYFDRTVGKILREMNIEAQDAQKEVMAQGDFGAIQYEHKLGEFIAANWQ